jgi:hypothetical protein
MKNVLGIGSAAVCLGLVAGMATPALSIDLITKSRSVKGYGKRDRDFPVSSETVSPSQIHEIYGTRIDAGADFTSARTKINGDTATASSSNVNARGVVGGDVLALGLAAGYNSISAKTRNTESGIRENFADKKLVPSIAATLNDNVTLGVSSEMSWIGIRQTATGQDLNQSLNGYTRREAIGLSYHTPKMEFGLMHTTLTNSRATTNETAADGLALGLTTSTGKETNVNDRDLYTPAANTIFARGNLTSNWSVQGTLSHTEYDANVEGAKTTFEKYRTSDRLAGQAQLVYWLDDEATRFSATAQYLGATYAPYGTAENALGYREANLYGGSVDAIFDVSNQLYLGLRVSHIRGERDQDVADAARIAAREDRTTFGTTLAKSF